MGAGVEGIASDGAWRLMFKLGPQMLPAVTQVRPRAMHGTTSQMDAGTVSRVSSQLYVSAITFLYRRDIFSLLHPRCPRRPNYIISRLIPATCTASASLPQLSRALHRLSVTFRDSHACAVRDRRIHVPDFPHTPHTACARHLGSDRRSAATTTDKEIWWNSRRARALLSVYMEPCRHGYRVLTRGHAAWGDGRTRLHQHSEHRLDAATQVPSPRRGKGRRRRQATSIQAAEMAGTNTARSHGIHSLIYAAGHAHVRRGKHRRQHHPNHHPTPSRSLHPTGIRPRLQLDMRLHHSQRTVYAILLCWHHACCHRRTADSLVWCHCRTVA